MLGMVLYDTFTVFLLKYLWSSEPFGKFLSTIFRNFAATFVFTSRLKGGLNHSIFRRLGFLLLGCGGIYFRSSLYPLLARASWYTPH